MKRVLLHVLVLATVLAATTSAYAEPAFNTDDTHSAIQQASSNYGVSVEWLSRVVNCESSFDPYAVGDNGTSLGAAQLHVGGNELARFYAQGYNNPNDPYQAMPFMASEFSIGRAGSWSCR